MSIKPPAANSSDAPVDEVQAAPSIPAVLPPEYPPETTALAEREALAFSAGETQRRRTESIRTHTHWATVLLFWLSVAAVVALIVTWVYHLITPAGWHYLSVEQRFELQTIVLSAVGSSFVTAMARRWVGALGDSARRDDPQS